MSKRRITQQQTKRIAQKHARIVEQQHTLNLSEGLVLTCFGKKALIESQSQTYICAYRQGIGGLVAGDKVLWHIPDANSQEGIIETRLPRTTELTRSDKLKQDRTVAANIDHVVVVVAAKPQISWPLLDSYLIMCDMLKLHVTIVLNKWDLDEAKIIAERLHQEYAPLGYSILNISSAQDEGIDALKISLENHISVFVGQSGVGKSTLIQKILPHELEIKTQAISERFELGRHTTSNARLYHLPSGGDVIDSPGVREFSLGHLDPSHIEWGYREFRALISACKFRNCTHINTPGCAIINAVENDKIALNRYQNFLALLKQQEM